MVNKKASSDASALANGEQLKPTPELERLLRERFTPEGKEEGVARSLRALRAMKPFNISLEQLKVLAEDKDLEEQ